jgi:site-specific recombinase XerC
MPAKRKCLECVERDEYVSEVRRGGGAEIYARQMNRYIDDFLRFCLRRYGQASFSQVSRKQIEEFAREIAGGIFAPQTFNPAKKANAPIRADTAAIKIRVVIKWYEWLEANGKIKKNPAEGLVAAELLRKADGARNRKEPRKAKNC